MRGTQWGIVAGLIVIGAFLLFIFRILKVGMYASHNFEKFICLGAAMVLGIHFLLNAGSAIGIFPVVGVPFSFLSYGGSNMVTTLMAMGILLNISTYQQVNTPPLMSRHGKREEKKLKQMTLQIGRKL